jgi:hypothetical protein
MIMESELADEATQALRWVLELRLTSAEWSTAEQAMASLDRAISADDQDAVRGAIFELDQLSRRVKEKLGRQSDTAPATRKQREQVADLEHRMAVPLDKGQQDAEKDRSTGRPG